MKRGLRYLNLRREELEHVVNLVLETPREHLIGLRNRVPPLFTKPHTIRPRFANETGLTTLDKTEYVSALAYSRQFFSHERLPERSSKTILRCTLERATAVSHALLKKNTGCNQCMDVCGWAGALRQGGSDTDTVPLFQQWEAGRAGLKVRGLGDAPGAGCRGGLRLRVQGRLSG